MQGRAVDCPSDLFVFKDVGFFLTNELMFTIFK